MAQAKVDSNTRRRDFLVCSEPGAQLRDQFSSKPVVLIGGNECA
jgi:hypothetical protein